MVRRFITVTLLTHVLGGCCLLVKKSRMAPGYRAAFYVEVRNYDQQNW